MHIRVVLTLAVAAACFAVSPAGPPIPAATDDPPVPEPHLASGGLPTDDEFAALLRTDPIRSFEAVLRRVKRDVQKFTCTMQKQERLGGTLGPVEEVYVAYRHDPYAVFMHWKGQVGFGKPIATLYVRGENGGKTRAKMRLTTVDVDPDSRLSRSAARYSIEDFGFYYTTLRTHRAWSAARDRGRFQFEYVEKRPVAECGGRTCHVIRRTCDPPEVDNFSLAEKGRIDPATNPKAAFATVTLMFDAETWLQVGSVMTDARGELVGAYYFRDVAVNPTFGPEQFTPAALQK
jgi:hypothetical protein